MAIATTTGIGVSRANGKGLIHKAFNRMITARERQARRYVNGYLLSLDDATLASYGYDRRELEREGGINGIF
ncbi:hypothetical protein H2509_11715 [Stappia sp. F7233]|uniref:Uncharacterized protein n=1 Tax=Stappia albiluteola TaxID=2758565 RepID=A0A839AE12_9HYPH|nr:hypothetical protein [Stappia albiluteola]MBA5777791.1 hypothetical protein [Stappia albiluteola]